MVTTLFFITILQYKGGLEVILFETKQRIMKICLLALGFCLITLEQYETFKS